MSRTSSHGLARRALVGVCVVALAAAAGMVGAVSVLGSAPAGALPAPGLVIVTVNEPSGSYYGGFCAVPGIAPLRSLTCYDANPPNLATGPVTLAQFPNPSVVVTLSLPAGKYNAAIANGALTVVSPYGEVDVLPGVSISCSFTMAAGPSCSPTPGPGPGTVIVTIDEPAGPTYAPGLCLNSNLVLLSYYCSDGSPNHAQFLGGGATLTLSLLPGVYTSALGSNTPALGSNTPAWHIGAIGAVQVVSGQTQTCSFTLLVAPYCTVIATDGASTVAAPGDSVSTVPPGGQSATDPVGTVVTTPDGGTVAIVESTNTETAPAGYSFFGQQVTIHAPAATVAAPLSISFHLDASIVPSGLTEQTIQLFRDGVAIVDCVGAPAANPDPCISLRQQSGGDFVITVLTSHASVWNFGAVTDATAPAIQITSPSDGAFVALNAQVVAVYACTDESGGSGVAICDGPVANGAWIDTSTTGLHSFTVTARDNATNSASLTHNYTVLKVAATKDDCKKNGWQQVVDSNLRAFKSQGDCVNFVATKGKNSAAG